MTCEYCGKYIPNQLTECPYCGAANPVYKQMEEELVRLKEKEAKLRTKLEDIKLDKETERQETEKIADNTVKMSAICSIVTAFAETVAFTLDRNVNFMIIFIVFYIGNLLGNSFLFAVLSGFKANKIVKLIFSAGFMIYWCFILN